MTKISYALLLFLVGVTAKQEGLKSTSSKTVKNDQAVSNDQVTSILVHPGPGGPRHLILSNDHQVISSSALASSDEGISSRAVNVNYFPLANFPSHAKEAQFHQTIPPPLTRVTYGPAQPVTFRRGRPEQQLYHNRFHQGGKISHSKAPLDDAVYKYSTYIKHDKVKDHEKDLDKEYYSSNYEKRPDYTVTVEREPHHKPQHEGLSMYRNRDEEEEIKFRESIGDLYSHSGFDKSNAYEEKKQRPLPYSKLLIKPNNYVSNNDDFVPNKNYHNSFKVFDNIAFHNNAPSGFDDYNGGKVVPVLAKFYKQPLPIIQTQLPADNVGLFIQYFQPQRSAYDKEEESNSFFDEYQGKLSLKRDAPSSEWIPINGPDGAVPAKAYDMPAPDLSVDKPVTSQKVYRRGSDDASVVIGKSKQKVASSSQHIQSNSEGVVSAVVRVKQ